MSYLRGADIGAFPEAPDTVESHEKTTTEKNAFTPDDHEETKVVATDTKKETDEVRLVKKAFIYNDFSRENRAAGGDRTHSTDREHVGTNDGTRDPVDALTEVSPGESEDW